MKINQNYLKAPCYRSTSHIKYQCNPNNKLKPPVNQHYCVIVPMGCNGNRAAYINDMGKLFSIRHETIDLQTYKDLSLKAKALYVILCKLKDKYGHKQDGAFNRSTKELSQDTGISTSSINRARQELIDTNLIECWISGDFHARQSATYRISISKQLQPKIKRKKTPRHISA